MLWQKKQVLILINTKLGSYSELATSKKQNYTNYTKMLAVSPLINDSDYCLLAAILLSRLCLDKLSKY